VLFSDGVTTMQFGKLEEEVYPKLEAYGIKQIAQRTAGFDFQLQGIYVLIVMR
jgi:lactate dehydrogenase-like 2-hydroxyacid dehydrogenase